MADKVNIEKATPIELRALAKKHGVAWGAIGAVRKALAAKLAEAPKAEKPAKGKKAEAEEEVEEKPTKKTKKPVKPEPEPEEEETEEEAEEEEAEVEKPAKKAKAKAKAKPAKEDATDKLNPVIVAVLGLLSALGLTVSDLLTALGVTAKPAAEPEADDEEAEEAPKASKKKKGDDVSSKIPKALRDYVKINDDGEPELEMEVDDLDKFDEKTCRELAGLLSVDVADVKEGAVRTLRGRLRDHLSGEAEEASEKPAKKAKAKSWEGFEEGATVLHQGKKEKSNAVVIDPASVEDEDIELTKGQVAVMFEDDSTWAVVKASTLTARAPSDDEEDESEDEESDDEE